MKYFSLCLLFAVAVSVTSAGYGQNPVPYQTGQYVMPHGNYYPGNNINYYPTKGNKGYGIGKAGYGTQGFPQQNYRSYGQGFPQHNYRSYGHQNMGRGYGQTRYHAVPYYPQQQQSSFLGGGLGNSLIPILLLAAVLRH